MSPRAFIAASLALVALVAEAPASPETTFTYQGELTENDMLVTATCDFKFSINNSPDSQNALYTLARTNVEVVEGRFSVELEYPAWVFANSGYWLEIQVRRQGSGSKEYTTLMPIQRITPSPYAIKTRGIHVNEGEDIGIGTNDPEARIHIAGDPAALVLEDTNLSGGRTVIEDHWPFQMSLSKYNEDGSTVIDLNPIASDGTSAASIRFFRETNTAGDKSVQFMRGDDTATPSAQVSVDGQDSFFQAHGGNLGIGTTTPTAKLEVRSNGSTTPSIYANNTASGGPALWAVGGSDVNAALGGVAVFGELLGQNIGIDGNEIMARDAAQAAPLHLNVEGGEVRFGVQADRNLAIRGSEILGRQGSSPGAIDLNSNGGEIRMGAYDIHPAFAYGSIRANGTIASASANVTGVTLQGANGYLISFAGGLDGTEIIVGNCALPAYNVGTWIDGDRLWVRLFNAQNTSYEARNDFTFVVYRP